ncbi:MAG: hypothetical protein MZV63_52015 [Marinilabiliales bacterium]|nr:hypothetical protein [Marinilabiliales bacterium]
MIPADSDDIKKEYQILVEELRKYNPELLDKTQGAWQYPKATCLMRS